jgi:hypothetical protein
LRSPVGYTVLEPAELVPYTAEQLVDDRTVELVGPVAVVAAADIVAHIVGHTAEHIVHTVTVYLQQPVLLVEQVSESMPAVESIAQDQVQRSALLLVAAVVVVAVVLAIVAEPDVAAELAAHTVVWVVNSTASCKTVETAVKPVLAVQTAAADTVYVKHFELVWFAGKVVDSNTVSHPACIVDLAHWTVTAADSICVVA